MAFAIKHTRGMTEHAGTAASASAIGAGAVAGLIGGVAMGMVAMIRAAAVGTGFFAPLKLIAGVFYGADAMQGGAGPIVVGLIIHVMMSAIFGAIFGLVVGRRWTVGSAFGMGLLWGAIIWAGMTWLVLPWANELMYDTMTQQMGWWFFYHMIFGAMLLLTPPLAARFSGNPMAQSTRPAAPTPPPQT